MCSPGSRPRIRSLSAKEEKLWPGAEAFRDGASPLVRYITAEIHQWPENLAERGGKLEIVADATGISIMGVNGFFAMHVPDCFRGIWGARLAEAIIEELPEPLSFHWLSNVGGFEPFNFPKKRIDWNKPENWISMVANAVTPPLDPVETCLRKWITR